MSKNTDGYARIRTFPNLVQVVNMEENRAATQEFTYAYTYVISGVHNYIKSKYGAKQCTVVSKCRKIPGCTPGGGTLLQSHIICEPGRN